jgi:hypothetical protein
MHRAVLTQLDVLPILMAVVLFVKTVTVQRKCF